ncbi:MAG TPA: hypothetical protein PLC17_13570 [Tenuifilaceae bacterium]|nr:hypothetical protein [Tenuifilaceae bacterium]
MVIISHHANGKQPKTISTDPSGISFITSRQSPNISRIVERLPSDTKKAAPGEAATTRQGSDLPGAGISVEASPFEAAPILWFAALSSPA